MLRAQAGKCTEAHQKMAMSFWECPDWVSAAESGLKFVAGALGRPSSTSLMVLGKSLQVTGGCVLIELIDEPEQPHEPGKHMIPSAFSWMNR